MSIADAGKNAQMAIMNMSPFEAQNLKLLDTVATTLEKIFGKMSGPAVIN
jgi:hypothetical protein